MVEKPAQHQVVARLALARYRRDTHGREQVLFLLYHLHHCLGLTQLPQDVQANRHRGVQQDLLRGVDLHDADIQLLGDPCHRLLHRAHVAAAVERRHEIRVIGQHPAQHDGVVLVGAQPGLAGGRRLLDPALQAFLKV